MTKHEGQHLDWIFRRALQFFEIRDGPRHVIETALNYSFAIGEAVAPFRSHSILHLETALPKNRLSEALTFLECSRLLHREGRGKGGVVLTPLPDWWHWGLTPISPAYANRDFLASVIGWHVQRAGADWLVRAVDELHPVVRFATAFAHGAFDQQELISPDETLVQKVAEVARAEALETAGLFRAGGTTEVPLSSIKSIYPESINLSSTRDGDRGMGEGEGLVPLGRNNPADEPDLDALGEKLFGPRWDARLRGLVFSYARNTSRRAAAITLQRGREQNTPIRIPHAWFKSAFQDVCQQLKIQPKATKEVTT